MSDDIVFPSIPPHHRVFRLIRDIEDSEGITRKEATHLVAAICELILDKFLDEAV